MGAVRFPEKSPQQQIIAFFRAIFYILFVLLVLAFLVLLVLASIFLFPGLTAELIGLAIGIKIDPIYVLLIEVGELVLYGAGIHFALKFFNQKSPL